MGSPTKSRRLERGLDKIEEVAFSWRMTLEALKASHEQLWTSGWCSEKLRSTRWQFK